MGSLPRSIRATRVTWRRGDVPERPAGDPLGRTGAPAYTEPVARPGAVAVNGTDPASAGLLIRAASVGALISGVAFAIHPVLVWGQQARDPGDLLLAAAAWVLALVLHVRHLRFAVRGRRAPAAGWTLPALVVLIVGPTPFLGSYWLPMFHVLASSAFLLLRLRWAAPAYVGTAVAAGAWSAAFDPGPEYQSAALAVYFVYFVMSRGLAPIVLVWVVVALRQLDQVREALAAEAVAIERRNIADAFHSAVGGQIEALVGQGERAAALTNTDPARAEPELRLLAGRSRRTLADARRLLHHQKPPARAELESAVELLRAAGIDASYWIPGGEPPPTLDDRQRSSLRRLTTALLDEEPVAPVVLELADDRVDLRRREPVG